MRPLGSRCSQECPSYPARCRFGVRLQTIEHRMEVYHMQPPSVTKKKTSERVEFRENM